ncbi:MAG: hypothetical protein Q4D27_01705 [Coriobacteriia bacterium]|nr:hypothetical protein [Coriobacteriia bacterium]
MEALRERVLDLIQSGFPLESDPYGVIAAQLGATRDDVLDVVAALRADGSIRRLGASFASKKLGYSSTLCALAVPGGPQEVDRVAAIVNAVPNVTHNYLRTNRYNLWFTIIARGPEEVARILSRIEEESGCPDALNLPATALYKIKVDFGEMKRRPLVTPSERTEPRDLPPARPFDADDPFDVALVRWAQEDIAGFGEAVDADPFTTAAAFIAAETGDSTVDEACVIARLRELKQGKVIRRFGALVAHRKMGYAFNGMTVWDVPAERADEVGKAFAAQPFVSHCYARPRSGAWPFNLYAMVHATTQEELDERVATLEASCGMQAQVLVSTREYKKTSMRYFTE